MSVVNNYRLSYHFEVGGKKATEDLNAIVQAAANDYNSLKTVLSNNSLLRSGTLVISCCTNLNAAGVIA